VVGSIDATLLERIRGARAAWAWTERRSRTVRP